MPEPEVTDQGTPPADTGDNPPADLPKNDTPPKESSDNTGDEFVDDNAEPERHGESKKDPEEGDKDPKDSPVDDANGDKNTPPNKDFTDELNSVRKELSDIKEDRFKTNVEKDINKILTENPEYKPYEARIRRFVNHSNRIDLIRNGLPVSTVALEAVAPYLQKIGAQKAAAADQKARETKVDGQPKGNEQKGKVDYSKMSNEEIARVGNLVKQGRYNPQAA